MIAFEPLVLAPALLAAALYARGFTTLARRMPYRFGAWRMVAFTAGLAVVLLAASPFLDEMSHALLQAHMTQHLMLMLVAPPLLWMGAPVAPLLLGLPRPLRRVVARWLGTPALRRLARVLAHPALGWTAFVIAFWAWHVPALYDLALRSDAWHHVEHASFFATALLFWRPVILPWPSRASWPLLPSFIRSRPWRASARSAQRSAGTSNRARSSGVRRVVGRAMAPYGTS